jgi:hypothetical protein
MANKMSSAAASSNSAKKAKIDNSTAHATSSSSSSSAGGRAVALPSVVESLLSHQHSLVIAEAANNNAALDSIILYTTSLTAQAKRAKADLARKPVRAAVALPQAKADLASRKPARATSPLASKIRSPRADATTEESEECNCCGSRIDCEDDAKISCSICEDVTVCRACAKEAFTRCDRCGERACKKECITTAPSDAYTLCVNCSEGRGDSY